MESDGNGLGEMVADCLAGASGRAAMVPVATLRTWIEQTGGTKQQFMVGCLPLAQAYARPTISGFAVGAVAMGLPVDAMPDGLGNIYFGASFEFRQQALALVVHAEQSAINNALLQGAQGVQYIAVSAPPCGYCRQFMYEVSNAAQGLTIIVAADGGYTQRSLSELLPEAFGPGNLGKAANLMGMQNNGLRHASDDPLTKAALKAANASYAPYTGNYCGVALQLADGDIQIGQYSENAAYNPGLLPMASALSQLNLSLPGQSAIEVTGACLLEAEAPISQFSAAQSTLSVIAPDLRMAHISVPR